MLAESPQLGFASVVVLDKGPLYHPGHLEPALPLTASSVLTPLRKDKR